MLPESPCVVKCCAPAEISCQAASGMLQEPRKRCNTLINVQMSWAPAASRRVLS